MRLTVVLVLTLLACSSIYDEEQDLKLVRKDTPLAECEQQGGKVESVCLSGDPECVHYFADAGKPCSDSSQCTWLCVAEWGSEYGRKTTGECKPHDNPCGCWCEVIAGRVKHCTCVD